MEPKFKVKIKKVEVPKVEEARFYWKYFPYWFCYLVNKLFRRRLIGKYRLSDYRLEKQQPLEKIHFIDIDKEIQESIKRQEKR